MGIARQDIRSRPQTGINQTYMRWHRDAGSERYEGLGKELDEEGFGDNILGLEP